MVERIFCWLSSFVFCELQRIHFRTLNSTF
ncbi:hypothetical protein OKW26_004862 [Paraburkholderia sp. 32]